MKHQSLEIVDNFGSTSVTDEELLNRRKDVREGVLDAMDEGHLSRSNAAAFLLMFGVERHASPTKSPSLRMRQMLAVTALAGGLETGARRHEEWLSDAAPTTAQYLTGSDRGLKNLVTRLPDPEGRFETFVRNRAVRDIVPKYKPTQANLRQVAELEGGMDYNRLPYHKKELARQHYHRQLRDYFIRRQESVVKRDVYSELADVLELDEFLTLLRDSQPH